MSQRLDQPQQRRVTGQAAVADGGVDAHQFLHDHPAGAEIGVSDLGIAHLAGGQADRQARGQQLGMGMACQQVVPVGGLGQFDGVVGALGPQAPAVEDAQQQRAGAVG